MGHSQKIGDMNESIFQAVRVEIMWESKSGVRNVICFNGYDAYSRWVIGQETIAVLANSVADKVVERLKESKS